MTVPGPMNGIRAQLAVALAQVAEAYNRIPADRRPDPAPVDGLDSEIDAAFASGDRERALAAIRAWRGHYLARFEQEAAR